MDSVLLYANSDPKLKVMFKKLGYTLVEPEPDASPIELAAEKMVDLIVLDCSLVADGGAALCQEVRGHESTRALPIMLITPSKEATEAIKELRLPRVSTFEKPLPFGAIAAKVATELRVRKIVGSDPKHKPTLSEANAALRDLNDRFKRELDDAREIQMSLLPRDMPRSDLFDLGVYYRPLEEVGGDWYFVQHDGESLSVQVADVTGHGLAAAFIGTMIKLAISASSRESAATLIAGVNRLVGPVFPSGRFATMGAIRLSLSSGEVEWASAAHPTAFIICGSSGEVRPLAARGFPLGFLDDADYEAVSGAMTKGDALVVYSDGLNEAINRARVPYGTDHLLDSVRKALPHATAQEIVDRIVSDFEAWRDGKMLKDDITILVIKR